MASLAKKRKSNWDVGGAAGNGTAFQGPCLRVIKSGECLQIINLSSGRQPGTVTFGRNTDVVDEGLDHASCSRQHAKLYQRDGQFYVVDLGSTHGTLLNGLRLTAERMLRNGDVVQFGESTRKYVFAYSVDPILMPQTQQMPVYQPPVVQAAAPVAAAPGYTIPIPTNMVGLIIGRGGSTINGIQGRTGTKVHIPGEPDADNPAIRSAVVTGTPQGVAQAKAEIMAIIQGRMQGGGGGMGGGNAAFGGMMQEGPKRFRYATTMTGSNASSGTTDDFRF